MSAEVRLGRPLQGSIALPRSMELRRPPSRMFVGKLIWWEVGFSLSGMNELAVRVDEKGRMVIPSGIRKKLNIKNVVKISVKGDEITLKPVEDPLRSLEGLVVKGTRDVEGDIGRLRRAAERELERGARCRPC